VQEQEVLGRRIADLRAKLGWTQQQLAERLAISRVALSHLEAGMSVASERTIALLASVFKVEPHELVAGTKYPSAKAERLPVVVARYTEVEHQLDLLEADLVWLERTEGGFAQPVLDAWEARLDALLDGAYDNGERAALTAALRTVRDRRAR
jgi:transcriptional regulator with XRE-family HTH domain